MTRRTNARLAGFFFLFYIANGLTSLVLSNQATGGATNTSAQLASLAQHASLVRWNAVLVFLTFVDAVFLGVALYGLTRDEDQDLALLALVCRVGEGVINALAGMRVLSLLSVARASVGAAGPDAAAAQSLGAFLMKEDAGGTLISATCFAIGSTIFAYLFLRARSIPISLAWVGLTGSALLVIGLPLQMAGVLGGPLAYLMWIPVALYEVTLGVWLLIKGGVP